MKDMKKRQDKRLEMLEAIFRYTDMSGEDTPFFYKDEMMRKLNVCEHVFNVIMNQLGESYCSVADPFEERIRYSVNVQRCLVLRKCITRENEKKERFFTGLRNAVFGISGVTFLVLFISCSMV